MTFETYAVLTLTQPTMEAYGIGEVEPWERDSLADALRDAEIFGRRYGIPGRLVTIQLWQFRPDCEVEEGDGSTDELVASAPVYTARAFYRFAQPGGGRGDAAGEG